MFSLTNYLRFAARQVSPLRPTPAARAASPRWLSSSTAVRKGSSKPDQTVSDNFNQAANDDLVDFVKEADTVMPLSHSPRGTTQAYNKNVEMTFKKWAQEKVTTVQDYRREGRIVSTEKRIRRKPKVLGPGAKESRAADPFYQLGINPLNEATNSRLLSHFVTTMGKIKSRAQTNLTWKSQRRLGKAIRRAKMMGIIPILSRRYLFSRGELSIPEPEDLSARRY